MLKRFALGVACLLVFSAPAGAYEYTDVYYNPTESGWGAFLVQSDKTQFIAFFVYGSDNKPTWYTAQLTEQPSGSYTGQLYATTGSWFGASWNGQQLTENLAGTASFTPIDIYRATLVYSVSGGPTVTKVVQRQTLTQLKIAGFYDGALAGTQSNCQIPANNDASLVTHVNLSNVQNGDTAAALNIKFLDEGFTCRADGPLTHFGRLYKMTNAQFTCTGPGAPPNTTVTINGLHPTEEGIEGHLTGRINNCDIDVGFSAVRSY
jgi:hypothetical protein